MSKEEIQALGYEVLPFLEGFILKKEKDGKVMYKSTTPFWREEVEPNTPMVLPYYSYYKSEEDAIRYAAWEVSKGNA